MPEELVQLKLARWLPVSAVACTALPLVLNILDVKLSSSAKKNAAVDSTTASSLKQYRLNILIEAMKIYQPQYDGVDWVSEIVRHIVNLAQLDSTNAQSSSNSKITDWTDILASQPSSYLRLALALDVSLSKGRLPEDGDFPVKLRGLFTGGFSPLKTLVEQNRTNDQNRSATGIGHVSMRPGTVYPLPSETDSRNSPLSQSDSHPSSPEKAANEALRNQIREHMELDSPANTHAPPSEGLEELGANDVFYLGDESPSV